MNSMNLDSLMDEYFHWLITNFILSNDHISRKERITFTTMFDLDAPVMDSLKSMPFIFSQDIPMDENRLLDALHLRRTYSMHVSNAVRKTWMENGYFEEEYPVSVLEVLIALADRCDGIYLIGTHKWLYILLRNMGLFAEPYILTTNMYKIGHIIRNFLEREYNSDGTDGGAFIIFDYPKDLRDIELWYQMCNYISNVDEEELTC